MLNFFFTEGINRKRRAGFISELWPTNGNVNRQKRFNIYLLRKNFIAGILILRFFIDLCGEWTAGNIFPDRLLLPWAKEWNRHLNSDEPEIARIANYWLEGKGFITDVSFDRPKFREEQTWPSALRNRCNVLYHAFFIKSFEFLNGKIQVDDQQNLPDSYFSFLSILFFIVKWLLTVISFFYLWKCSTLFFSQAWADWVVILFALYPSGFYIFPINMWDTFAAPLTLIIISKFILHCSQEKVEKNNSLFSACWLH